MPASTIHIVNEDALLQGYNFTIDNAIRLLDASTLLQNDFPDKALAIAQLGQEEIGKSLTLLAAFHLTDDPEEWKWFWRGWKNHVLKAQRAYLYEIFNPLRIELVSSDGSEYSGFPFMEPISREKEVGLYVDFDQKSQTFTTPISEVTPFESMGRISTLLYLSSTADAIRRAMLHANPMLRLKAFGSLAFTICSETIYQQDMPSLLENFSLQSALQAEIVRDLGIALEGVNEMFKDAVQPSSKDL